MTQVKTCGISSLMRPPVGIKLVLDGEGVRREGVLP
jgi:hypothetical protein